MAIGIVFINGQRQQPPCEQQPGIITTGWLVTVSGTVFVLGA
jgi:hypothetical protein